MTKDMACTTCGHVVEVPASMPLDVAKFKCGKCLTEERKLELAKIGAAQLRKELETTKGKKARAALQLRIDKHDAAVVRLSPLNEDARRVNGRPI